MSEPNSTKAFLQRFMLRQKLAGVTTHISPGLVAAVLNSTRTVLICRRLKGRTCVILWDVDCLPKGMRSKVVNVTQVSS
mgnify:FL=1